MYNYDEMIDRLKFILSKNKISVKRLSELTDIPYRTLYKIISKETREPSVNTIIKIANVLNISTDTLIYSEHTKKKDKINFLSDNEIIIIDKYRKLDIYGKEVMDNILNIEYRRCEESDKCIISVAARGNSEQKVKFSKKALKDALDNPMSTSFDD